MILTIFTSVHPHFGYVDGGTGSMIFQAVLAAGFAAAYGFRGALAKVASFVKRGSREPESEN